jgi:hypothetical protein
MQQKVIKLQFNTKFFLNTHKAIWAFSGNKKIAPNIFYTVLAIFCLTVGFTPKKDDFPLTTVFGGGYLFYMILIWIGFFERRIRFFKKVKKYAVRYEQERLESTYIFSDDEFQYSDKEKTFRLSWALFKPVVIFKDNILLTLIDGGMSFALSREELGEEDYIELCFILKTKNMENNSLPV